MTETTKAVMLKIPNKPKSTKGSKITIAEIDSHETFPSPEHPTKPASETDTKKVPEAGPKKAPKRTIGVTRCFQAWRGGKNKVFGPFNEAGDEPIEGLGGDYRVIGKRLSIF